jgi:cobalt-zinc-cadmium efflux system membrane fusion protein
VERKDDAMKYIASFCRELPHPTTRKDSKPMPMLPSFLSPAAALVALVAFGTAACGPSEKPDSNRGGERAGEARDGRRSASKENNAEQNILKLTEAERKAAGIAVETLKVQTVTGSISVTATVRPNQDRIAHVAPRVEGRIIAVAANLGDRVKAGQTLATLDSLELGEAHSAYLQALSAYRVAQADLKRADALNADEIIPVKEFVRAKAEHEKTSAALRAAEDKLRMLGVAPDTPASGRAVSTFPLIAPFAGTVIEKHAILGELSRPEQTMFTIADLSRLWIEANLAEQDLARVRAGLPAVVTVAAYPNERFAGRVTYVASVLDKETRTVPTRIEVGNRDGRLRPEMFATAFIEVEGAQRDALAVPEEAIVLLQGQTTVFVEEHGGFEPRPVELGERLAGRAVVKAGIEAGSRVVVAGAYALKARMLKSQLGEGH